MKLWGEWRGRTWYAWNLLLSPRKVPIRIQSYNWTLNLKCQVEHVCALLSTCYCNSMSCVCKADFFLQKEKCCQMTFYHTETAYLFPVVLNRHTKNALCPVACDLINFCIEARVLGRKTKWLYDWSGQALIRFSRFIRWEKSNLQLSLLLCIPILLL